MMDRYFKPPEINGRPLNILRLTRGKKHFWGEKGKNYGFFTTAEENDMELRRKQHRRIKSQAYDYLNDKSGRYRSNLYQRRTIPAGELEGPLEGEKRVQKNYATIGVQSDADLIKTKEAGVEAQLTLRQQMQSVLDRSKTNRQVGEVGQTEEKGRYYLPEIKYKSESLKTQDRNRQKRPSVRFIDEVQFANGEPAPKSKERVVYYARKNRMNNPTFCNSIAYPLPCYRYIG